MKMEDKEDGYELQDFGQSGYNPVDYIRHDDEKDTFSARDIKTIASVLVPVETEVDPFWSLAARQLLECLIAYVMECLPWEEQSLVSVLRLFSIMGSKEYNRLFFLDDFAANAFIPEFDKITSVIRSREISVSIIPQSLSQLENMHGGAGARTILNNCDNCLYLGGQDVEMARYISQKANKSASSILNMPLKDAWLFQRGTEPRQVEKYVPQEEMQCG